MGKRKRIEQERFARQQKKQKTLIVVGVSVIVCAIIGVVISFVNSMPASSNSMNIALDSNGDLRIPINRLQNNLNYVNFGGKEELILWQDNDGVIRTAFDTCAECYSLGNVHFSLHDSTLTCNQCGTTQPVSALGVDSWGGCQPVSLIPDIRNDTETEVVLSANVLSYAAMMFTNWDAANFSVTFSAYENDGN